MVTMETPSPSLIIIWGKMARGLLPRVTPPAPFSRLRFLSPTPLPPQQRWQLRFFFFSSSSSSSTSSAPSSTYSFSLLLHHLLLLLLRPRPRFPIPPPPTASSTSSTPHPASPRRLIAPRHLLCPPREYYACTLPGRLCNHP